LRKMAAVSKSLDAFCRSLAGVLMLAMMVLVFAETISRYVFGLSHEFVPAISSWLMVWVTYLMLGVVLKTREHINVDILPTRIPRKYRVPLLTSFDIISLIFAVLLCFGGIRYDLMVKQLDIHVVTVQFFPVWIVRIGVPLGAFFLAFFAIEHLTHDVRHLMKRSGEEP
jgi:TRAP-type C4-dicarboxylate transport system permease small subunit